MLKYLSFDSVMVHCFLKLLNDDLCSIMLFKNFFTYSLAKVLIRLEYVRIYNYSAYLI